MTFGRIGATLLLVCTSTLTACAGAPKPVVVAGSFGSNFRATSVVTEQMASEPARLTLALLNQYRAKHGLAAVALDPQMTQVAYQQAKAMADVDFMDHNIIADFGSRLKMNHVTNVYAGENIGRNIRTADRMFDWWVHSPVHEANIANPRVTRLGFAVAYSKTGRPYWAMAVASQPLS
jgi:uncharacterized protein YkwD